MIQFVDGSLDITKAPLTVTADANVETAAVDAFSKVYGSANPAFTVRYGGFVLGQGSSVLGGTLGFMTTATASSDVASYSVTPGGLTSSNYQIQFVHGTLAVTKAPLLVKVDANPATPVQEPFTKLYGAGDPAYSVRYEEFVLGQDASVLGGTLTYTTTAPPSGVGAAVVTAIGQTSSNYAIQYVSGTLNIQYRWDGYLQPINDTAHMVDVSESKFRFGQTIPVKFNIKRADGTIVQQSGSPTFTYGFVNATCDSSLTSESLPDGVAPSGGQVFDWDGTKYQYNWSTKGLNKQGEYRVYANLADGTRRHVDICLTK
ncbi:hypothetical protein GCM10009843_14060 [Nocardioides bigeumensis]|uniref:MBG domain-containing protein n=1 Tax=Nocardioides bigeumensis TaxID=433657 RepID=A0ABP5JUY0_9ACTN